MAKQSAGLLIYRVRAKKAEVLLVHPGGPFWAKKDLGAWSIPKGEYTSEENPLHAALREFKEETGLEVNADFIPLEPIKQPSGKMVIAWAIKLDIDVKLVKSNTFSMEWPPGSGRSQEFPEIDKAEWFPIEEAKQKINKGQVKLLEQLMDKIKISNNFHLE